MSFSWVAGGVTAAAGFRAAGMHAGITRSRRPDLALVVADGPVAAAAVFTRNRVQAAPVVISRARIRRGRAGAIVLNSGGANCLTGRAGLQDALAVGRAAARALGMPEREILLASTGMIGRRLPAAPVCAALPGLAKRLRRGGHRDAARAILTTDTAVKEAAVRFTLGGRSCHVGGMAKGAGMIAPSMATMLCVLTTDAGVAPGLLRALVRRAVAKTFNRISVDGDMSTNDTVFALASGRSGSRARSRREAAPLAAALDAVCERLAYRIVRDGEGATRLMTVDVEGARSPHEADAAARQVAYSPLVKTMLAGADPNPGRIAGAVGASGAVFNPGRLDIWISGRQVVRRGTALALSKAAARTVLARPAVGVRIDLHAGRCAGRMVTCDLTTAYVRINAGYAT